MCRNLEGTATKKIIYIGETDSLLFTHLAGQKSVRTHLIPVRLPTTKRRQMPRPIP